MNAANEPSHDERRQQAMDRVFLLKGIPLFAGLSAEELLPVAEICRERSCEKGEVVFEQGADGDSLYLIAEGAVEVVRAEQRLALLRAPECVGEMAILDRSPRSATVRALEPTRLLTVTQEDFRDLLDLYPALSRAVAAVIAGRLRQALAEIGG